MAKRKRAAKKVPEKVAVPEVRKVPPITEAEGQYFKELVETSNRYIALMQQQMKYEFVVKKLEDNRLKIQKDEYPMPFTLALIPNVMFYQEHDKKKILKIFDEQLTSYRGSIKAIKSQIDHRYEEYVESAVRNREFLIRKYGTLKAKQVAPDRKIIKDEEDLFEAEFSELLTNPEKLAEFKNAKKEAVKRNKARKTKCECATCVKKA